MSSKHPFHGLLHRTTSDECREAVLCLLDDGVPMHARDLISKYGLDTVVPVLERLESSGACHVVHLGDVPMIVPGPRPAPSPEPVLSPAPPALPQVRERVPVEPPPATYAALPPDATLAELSAYRTAVALEQLVAVMASTVKTADFTPRHDEMVIDVLRRIVVILAVRGPLMQTAIRRSALSSQRGKYIPEAVILGIRYGVLDAISGFRSPLRLIDHRPVMSDEELDSAVREQRLRDDARRLS
ncbi:MAG: hypothetical protein E6R04_08525 [Spirochaetes bacterium]|nr:MAG: hypothetical protein E6R04_08525 [Spirochaetota bacterium]